MRPRRLLPRLLPQRQGQPLRPLRLLRLRRPLQRRRPRCCPARARRPRTRRLSRRLPRPRSPDCASR
ncbi:MAG: hypothetical protein DCC57_24750 [Chloroflexi bacterium]|nr:MAG: hypothetical protein DCC57_24750 [Chloroflexota bacterium]